MDQTSAADRQLLEAFRAELIRARDELRANLQALVDDRANREAGARLERQYHTLKGSSAAVSRQDLSHLASSLQIAISEALERGFPIGTELLRRLIEQTDGLLYAGGQPALSLRVPDTGTRRAVSPTARTDTAFGRDVHKMCGTAGELLRRMNDLTIDRSSRGAAWEELGALLQKLKGAAVLEGDFKLAGLSTRLLEMVRAGMEEDPLGLRLRDKVSALLESVGLRLEDVAPVHKVEPPPPSVPDIGPGAPPPADGRAVPPAPAPAAPAELTPALREQLGRLRVVFVDDSLPMRKVAERLLGELGVKLRLAPDGCAALDLLRQEGADVLFTDVEMPRMHGYQLVAELRAVSEWKDLPVVVVTSHSGEKHRQSAETAGATDTLTKPFSRAILLEKLLTHGRLRL